VVPTTCQQRVLVYAQVRARAPALWVSRPDNAAVASAAAAAATAEAAWMKGAGPLRPALVRQQLFFPDRNLIQYDCGKLQVGTFACTVGLLSRTLSQVQRQRFCQTATSSSTTAEAAGGHLCLYSGVVISNTEPGTAATLLPDRNLIQYDCGKLQVGTFACTVGLLSRTLSQVQRQRFCQTATSSSAAAAAVASVPSSATAAGCAAPMASFPSSATAAGCASLLTSYPSDSATAA